MGNINFKVRSRIRDANGEGVRLSVRMLQSGQPAISTNELLLVMNALKRNEQASTTPNNAFTYVFPFALADGGGFTYTFPITLAADTGIAILG